MGADRAFCLLKGVVCVVEMGVIMERRSENSLMKLLRNRTNKICT